MPRQRNAGGVALPLSVEGDHLVVRGRDRRETRLPLTGDGAVTALAPYRYSTSTRSEEHGRGTRTWWRVGDRRRGQRPLGSPRSTGWSFAEAGAFRGRWWQWSFHLEVEWGIAALGRNGDVLLRMRPLRSIGQVRRFAQAYGLAFVEEQLTDPGRLAPAPAVVTSAADTLSRSARTAVAAASLVLAGAVGLGAHTAMGDDPSAVEAVLPAVASFAAFQGLFRWLLGRRGARSRG